MELDWGCGLPHPLDTDPCDPHLATGELSGKEGLGKGTFLGGIQGTPAEPSPPPQPSSATTTTLKASVSGTTSPVGRPACGPARTPAATVCTTCPDWRVSDTGGLLRPGGASGAELSWVWVELSWVWVGLHCTVGGPGRDFPSCGRVFTEMWAGPGGVYRVVGGASKLTSGVSCPAGCYPKCPPESPIFDEDQMQCVATCPTPPPAPCRVAGQVYLPGAQVPSEQNCQSW